jgi:precorrin-6B methylase 2
MRALTTVGIFTEMPGKKFKHTPTSELLKTGTETSMRGMAMWMSSPEYTSVWSHMDKAMETGTECWSTTFGKPLFEYLETTPAMETTYQSAMTAMTRTTTPSICSTFDFTPFTTICDIGGGCGTLLAAALRTAPKAKGMLIETPTVTSNTQCIDATLGDTKPRVTVIAGDMFKAETTFPKADLFMMKNIMQNWSDERCKKILTNCTKNLTKGGKVVIFEQIMRDEPNTPTPAAWTDVQMLVATPGGRERTMEEFKTLLTACGLKCTTTTTTTTPTTTTTCTTTTPTTTTCTIQTIVAEMA